MRTVVRSRDYRSATRSSFKCDNEMYELIKKECSVKKSTMASLIRSSVMKRIRFDSLPELAAKPPENKLHLLAEVSPDAIVYTAPSTDIKIVAAPSDENGWRGLIFDPSVVGSLEVWNSENLNVPVWAKTKNIMKTLLFIRSRIDSDGFAYFDLPDSQFLISAKFENGRWNSGDVINGTTKERVPWIRHHFYSHIDCQQDPHRWGTNRNIRRYLNLLTGAIRCGDGGIEK